MKKYTQNLNPLMFEAVDKLVDLCKPTYGPAQNKVLIEYGRHLESLDDGVAIARQFELTDEFENAIVQLVKEVAQKTNDRVGDGTTSSLIMLQALMKELKDNKKTSREVIKELQNGLEEFKTQITSKARQITTKEDLKKVAYISFNNEKMAEVIAEILFELGHEAIVTIEESRQMETTYDVVKGLRFPRGFASPYFINNPEKAETVLEKPYILVTDKEIYDPKELLPLLNKVIATGNRQLVVIADDIRGEAMATLIINYMKNVGLFPAIKAPYYSNDKYEFLMDLAAVTGANFVAGDLGRKLEDTELNHLGTAERVIITKDHTTIIGGSGSGLDDYVKKLKAIIETTDSDIKKDKMKERLAKLTSGVAVIKVGGATENEMKALRAKVEDAVNATRVAYKSGVVKGAGVTLGEVETSSEILNKALKYPHKQLLENMEVESLEVGEDIIDPVEVLIAGVESAVSIVSLLITTKGILVDKEEEKKNE
ncbi:chaperonin GroEL [Candidatus Woesearchaeota archaeon]|nr:chaperonin GroEL [Candidatus Woesearchaeota archaeon]